ncbi:KpsF/GutQ family sugar-phosphate isomerase [Vibrio metschnikovii]|uniref:KpsF/GutQ family sugar-phosphate isomerase n=3 Tax=Bacteria TaxID=2 RepID=UPI0021C3FA22|nr:KpsF/GutQ family sugar-phosphate isomerase [Vibrio metschnikovii]
MRNENGQEKMTITERMIQCGKQVIQQELEQGSRLQSKLDKEFANSCIAIQQCKGKIVLFGIGKSGHIGKKIAATFASTGSAAFFIHPAEALHGDLGMVTEHDLAILISYSGEANEFKTIVPLLLNKRIPIIAITGQRDSYLAKHSHYLLDIHVEKEACPLGLAPTSSTTNTLLIGDALALTVMSEKNFTAEEFAFSHPAGALGTRLLTQVHQLMTDTHTTAYCSPQTCLTEVIEIMCRTGLGLIAVVEEERIQGVFTDGDLRRALHGNVSLTIDIKQLMTNKPTVIIHSTLCHQALSIMRQNEITALPVINEQGYYQGVINQQTIQRAGIF